MPTHLRLRCAWQFKDSDPKNQAVINPCFRRQLDITDPTSGTDAQQLCDDMAAILQTFQRDDTMLTVSAYNIEGAKPNHPLASKVVNASHYNPPVCAPELAVCLSFYDTVNAPRHRGRLYLPVFMFVTAAADVYSGVIPASLKTKVATLPPAFAGLGGANVDWIVWSTVDHAAHKVQNWWIDDAWDIQRRRGLKATSRQTGTTTG